MKKIILKRIKYTHAGLLFLAGVFLILVGPSLIPTSSAANNTIVNQFIDSNNTVHGALLNSGIFNLITNVPVGTYRVSVEYTTKKVKTLKIESSTFKYGDPTVQFNFNTSGTNAIEVYSSDINTYNIKYRGQNNELISSQKFILYGKNGQKKYTTLLKKVTASIEKNANSTGAGVGTGSEVNASIAQITEKFTKIWLTSAKEINNRINAWFDRFAELAKKLDQNQGYNDARMERIESKLDLLWNTLDAKTKESNRSAWDQTERTYTTKIKDINTASKTSESHQAAGSK